MQKIKFIVDSTSDIPDEALERYGIEMLSVPINVDGVEYMERHSFTTEEFYSILAGANELPVTSRISVGDYAEQYEAAYHAGYTDIINVTITANGSGIYDSACMAVNLFFQEHPEAKEKIHIHVVDSRAYSIAYGVPVIQAAQMVQNGSSVQEVLDFLEDRFSRQEIYLACYSLEYAKRSGRITAASAVVGDALGLRPIISLIDGKTKTVEKVRGDKNVVPKLAEIYHKRHHPDYPDALAASGCINKYGEDLRILLEQQIGQPVPHYKIGASIAINSGPRVAAVCLLGEKRSKQ